MQGQVKWLNESKAYILSRRYAAMNRKTIFPLSCLAQNRIDVNLGRGSRTWCQTRH